MIALKRNLHPSQSESESKRIAIDVRSHLDSDSEFYDEDLDDCDDYDTDLMGKAKELHSEFPQTEVDIFNTPKIEVILVSTVLLTCFYVAYWN